MAGFRFTVAMATLAGMTEKIEPHLSQSKKVFQHARNLVLPRLKVFAGTSLIAWFQKRIHHGDAEYAEIRDL